MNDTVQGPLRGIRVADMTSVLLGPWATEILGDLGADVIKVEAPGGETTRNTGPAKNKGMAAGYLAFNRNKRSLCIDLKKKAGRKAFLKILKTIDVLVHNMRPSAMTRLGLDYESVRRINPEILYCGAYGYAQNGPYADKPAYDDVIQGCSGLAWAQTLYTGKPGYMPILLADKVAALTLVYSIGMGLFHRERTGQGQQIDVPMFETLTSFTMMEHMAGTLFDPPVGKPGWTRVLSPHRRPFQAKDGLLGVLPYSDRHWKQFFEISGKAALFEDPRFADMPSRVKNIDALYSIVEEIITQKTTKEWIELLEDAGIPVVLVNSFEDLMKDPHLEETRFWQTTEHPTEGKLTYPGIPSRFSKTPGSIHRHAPELGEHSCDVLEECGFSDHEIKAMIDGEVITCAL